MILKTRPSRILRLTLYTLICASSLYFLLFVFRNREAIPEKWPYYSEKDFEMVGQNVFPDFPTPVVVQDSHGRSRWTVSIPPSNSFPLTTEEYSEMSTQCREVSARARDLHRGSQSDRTAMTSYDAHDPNFVDVDEAERMGLLVHPLLQSHPKKSVGHFVGADAQSVAGKSVCKSSMTFVLETTDAGLGNTLMMLWTFYGLAKEQGRAFFIDDSRWAYGDFTNIFKPPPGPACRPPPRHQMVPCPFQARHLVVSAMTAKEVFPSLLAQHHRSVGTDDKVQDLWKLARTGYEALFKINQEDEEYVEDRVLELKGKSRDGVTAPNAPIIGLHVRRGDRHPIEAQYHTTYIPGAIFQDKAEELADSRSPFVTENSEVDWKRNEPIIVLASDDPTVHDEPEFVSSYLSQERIQLASKEVTSAKPKKVGNFHHFIEEDFGWEGGFYPPMFWNLGVTRRNNGANAPAGVEVEEMNEQAKFTAKPTEMTLQLRSLVGRAYIMDLAVLARASDGVVCAVSAMGCRLLGVMMDWEKGVGGGGWVNVDGDYGWTGIEW